MTCQSIHFHETWAYLRDNAKPIAPNDVWDLRKVREDMPPSRKHIKVLARRRASVVPPSFKALATGEDPGGQRAALIALQKRAKATLEACGISVKPYVAHPVPAAPLRPVPINIFIEPVKAKAKAEPVDQGKKLAREHMLRMSKMVYREYAPSLDEIVYAFGSVEAWETAKVKG